jgi:hypothetical protein
VINLLKLHAAPPITGYVKTWTAIVVCALAAGCDEAESGDALARQRVEADAGSMFDDELDDAPSDERDASAKTDAINAQDAGAESTTTDGGSDEQDGAVVEQDAAGGGNDASAPFVRTPRTGLVLADVHREVFDPSCVSCHSGGQGALPLMDVGYHGDNFLIYIDLSPRCLQYVEPYMPEKSYVLAVFEPALLADTQCAGVTHSPLEHPPTQAQLDTLRDWIAGGAKKE